MAKPQRAARIIEYLKHHGRTHIKTIASALNIKRTILVATVHSINRCNQYEIRIGKGERLIEWLELSPAANDSEHPDDVCLLQKWRAVAKSDSRRLTQPAFWPIPAR